MSEDYWCGVRTFCVRRIIFCSIGIVFVATSFVLRASPADANPAHEVEVVEKQFAFEPAVIQVTAGEPVRLVIHSSDRVTGAAIRDLKIASRFRAVGTLSSNSQPRTRGATKSPAPSCAAAGTSR